MVTEDVERESFEIRDVLEVRDMERLMSDVNLCILECTSSELAIQLYLYLNGCEVHPLIS